MSPKAVANSAYSLCLIAFDAEDVFDAAFRGAHETLLSIITKAGRVLGATKQLNPGDEQFDYPTDVADISVADAPINSINSTDTATAATDTDDEAVPLMVQEIEQLRIFAHYVKVMQFVSDTKRVPESLLMNPQAWATPPPQRSVMSSSRLQERVVQGLEDALQAHAAERSQKQNRISAVLAQFAGSDHTAGFRMESEISSFDGVFPVDAAVLRGQRILALLEVDGPFHYRRDGRLRRKDMLKETLYRRQHPNSVFHRIRWDEEQKIGSDVLAKELVELVLKSSASQDNIIVESVRSVQKSMADFFCWSMRNSNDLNKN